MRHLPVLKSLNTFSEFLWHLISSPRAMNDSFRSKVDNLRHNFTYLHIARERASHKNCCQLARNYLGKKPANRRLERKRKLCWNSNHTSQYVINPLFYLLRRPFKKIKLVGNERKGLRTNFPKWREPQTKLLLLFMFKNIHHRINLNCGEFTTKYLITILTIIRIN